MLGLMPTPHTLLQTTNATPALREHYPGIWLASSALVPAADAAKRLCPEALALAAAHYPAASRRQSFLAGRSVAAAALSALQLPVEVGRDSDGAPLWPAGAVGSIAHDALQAVAMVGRSSLWRAVGVDVEPDQPLPADAASLVLRAEDHIALRDGFGSDASRNERLVFCAKECVHKALHPWRGVWLEFEEVFVQWTKSGPDGGQWEAMPASESARRAFDGLRLAGEWWRGEGALWSLVAISRSGS